MEKPKHMTFFDGYWSVNACRMILLIGLTCWVSGLRVRTVPSRGRRAVPHAILIGRQVSHGADSPVAVSSHGAVRELRVRHVVGVMAHAVLLQVRLRHRSLSVQRRRKARAALHGCKLLEGLLDRAQNIAHWERRWVFGAQGHGSARERVCWSCHKPVDARAAARRQVSAVRNRVLRGPSVRPGRSYSCLIPVRLRVYDKHGGRSDEPNEPLTS